MPPTETATMHGPDAQTLQELGVATPLPLVHLPQFRHFAQTAYQAHAACQLNWLPVAPWPGVRPVVETLCDAGAAGVACHHLRHAIAAVESRADAVTILLPPVAGVGPERVAELTEHSRISVVVDHFAQAEALAAACVRRSTSLELLLRIDVGRERLGVRPGPDLHDLARGVAALPGVRLAGITVEASTAAARGVASLKQIELARLLKRCRNSLERAGVMTEVVCISRLGDLDDADGRPCEFATHARTPLAEEASGSFAVVAGVIGRPTRHQAVIDAGRFWIGEAASVVWPGGRQARLTAVDEASSVLHVDAAGHGLAIGDVVVIAPPQRLLSVEGAVLVDDGDRWRCVTTEAASFRC